MISYKSPSNNRTPPHASMGLKFPQQWSEDLRLGICWSMTL